MDKSSNRGGRWRKQGTFIFRALDEDGSGNIFNTSQIKTDAPTLYLQTLRFPGKLYTGEINRIHYRLNPTNAATYILRIWSGTVAAAPYALNMRLIYESPALQADDTDYDRAELTIPFVLSIRDQLFYSIEWTAAPGNTPGFIEVGGEINEN